MKRKSRIYRVGALLLVLCFISTVMISGTFAKYTSEYVGQDTALVAKWSFKGFAGQVDSEENTTKEFALFDHLYNTHINQKDGDGDNAKYIIAPGVNGEFVLKMDYLADVAADVTIEIEKMANSANVPVEYSLDEGDNWVTLDNLATSWAKIIANDEEHASNIVRLEATDVDSDEAYEIDQTVQWRWAYEVDDDTDLTDTALGIDSYNAAHSEDGDGDRTFYGIKITLTAEQVAPVVTPGTP